MLIYGATGYTGRLIVAQAVDAGLRPILAARRRPELEALAQQHGLTPRAFALDDAATVRAALDGISLVLNAAGPFSATARPLVDACLAAGAHYVDVTGEISVFEMLAARSGAAGQAGITLLPGAGFDVVPSDCLAAHVAGRLPGARRLRLAIRGLDAASRGTMKTMIEALAFGTSVRRDGRLVELRKPPQAMVDFGSGPQRVLGIGWGDVATAWRSTNIPEIDVFFASTPALAAAGRMPGPVKGLLASAPAQRFLKRQIERRLPPGPTPAQRARARTTILAEAWDAAGRHVASRLSTPEAYELTARTAVAIAQRIVRGGAPAGYQTPATAFGADFILGFADVTRTDLA